MASTEIVPIMPPLGELPPEIRALKSDRHRIFVWSYMFNGANGAAAARAAGFSDVKDGAKVRSHGLLLRDDINAALQALSRRYLFMLAPKAISALAELLGKPDHRQHAKAIELTLNRTGFAERRSLDVNVSGTVTVDHTSEALDQLRALQELGVPRDRLVEIFGFSGLARYERLLVGRDRQLAGPVVEHEDTDPT